MAEPMNERDWNDRPLALEEAIELKGVKIRRTNPGHMMLLSGKLSAGLAGLSLTSEPVGFGGEVGKTKKVIRIGIDSALCVTGKPAKLQPGWYKPGFAVSLADGKYAALKISGKNAGAVLAQGTGHNLEQSSRSAAVEFAGCVVLMVKTGSAWLLFVETPMLTYVTNWFRGVGASV
ncbi:MAG: hypothetical protein AAF412_11155 [Pseudomonadota bacterium]